MEPRKLALVGIGKIARDQHIPSLNASKDWELVATVSRHAQVDGIEAFEDIETMLAARPDIDVISLCVPPAPRFAYAAAALNANRHVMLEKPPGATLSECHVLGRMAEKAGRSIYATWHSREAAMVDAARVWLSDKQVHRVEMQWKEDVRYWHPGQDWVFDPGGMGVFDPGINGLSILTKILPKSLHITSATLDFPENRQTPIAAQLAFHYPGASGSFAELDWLQQGDPVWSIFVETDAGVLTLENGGARMLIDGEEIKSAEDALALQGEYPRLYARMNDLVAKGESEMDLRPMYLVADAFAIGERRTKPAFEW
ncbi:D-galactose 1-dehydrogenase [Maritalea myrionectae]|uniref:D-galactose 1-dehydrogenase n=1 Tax=Maritalea myrionectae TaxID=454601 RepID=A0A2R4MFP7_9HYPH|nr:Gfo/Idh/MocA family oxidoreductase [Maritalea myrionectae]AVX04871.1 D-galactose 1-dehydrogenase [Maritalea myrionectae]